MSGKHIAKKKSGGKSEGKRECFKHAMACVMTIWWNRNLKEGQGAWIQEQKKDINEKTGEIWIMFGIS